MISPQIILSDYLIWLLICLPGVLWFTHHHRLAIRVSMSAGIAWLASIFIKDFFYFPRPFPRIFFDGSFPSSHAAVSFAIAVSIFIYSKNLGAVCLILAVLVAWGRVLAHVHYPTDVLAGALLGSAVAAFLTQLKSRD